MKDQRPEALKGNNNLNNVQSSEKAYNPQANGQNPSLPDSTIGSSRKVEASTHAARIQNEEVYSSGMEKDESNKSDNEKILKGNISGINYRILGDDIQQLEITLEPGQSVIGDIEGMLYLQHGIGMKTRMSQSIPKKKNFIQKIFGIGKGLLVGEKIFVMTYGNTAKQPKKIAFAQPKPGCIKTINLSILGGSIMCLKSALLCASSNVRIATANQREIGSGLFGASIEMETLQGDGVAFVQAGGIITEHTLAANEIMNVSLGGVLMKQSSVDLRRKTIPNVGLTGEGYKITTLKGPGKVWLQSLPINKLHEKSAIFTDKFIKKKKSQLGGIFSSASK